jgi:glyoxylase-like metal-dependent hydrolase (beta-lactamase superfamily II)
VSHGRWIIVDSCIDGTSRGPKPLDYLNKIGVDVTSAVEVVVATHWHDDHVRGISKILQACQSAIFCCAGASVYCFYRFLKDAIAVNQLDSGGAAVKPFFIVRFGER